MYIYKYTSQMLDGARDADSDVELGCHHLAGLPDLQQLRLVSNSLD